MQEESLLKGIAAIVKSRRKELRRTAQEVAQAAGLSLRFLAQLEKGEANISIVRLQALAVALELPLPQLLHCALLPPKSIALLGLRGAGKSTVGPVLAELLGWDFTEVDERVEERCGLNLTEIFSLHGESFYRRIEAECLESLLETSAPRVLALSGGVVHNERAFSMLMDRCTTVWLQATPQQYMQRVLAQGDHRPIANRDDAMSELQSLLAGRVQLYQRANMAVDTSIQSPDQVAREIANQLR